MKSLVKNAFIRLWREENKRNCLTHLVKQSACKELRGAEKRWWADVQIGDKLGPMIKGPLGLET